MRRVAGRRESWARGYWSASSCSGCHFVEIEFDLIGDAVLSMAWRATVEQRQ